jgi:hypothetical protein
VLKRQLPQLIGQELHTGGFELNDRDYNTGELVIDRCKRIWTHHWSDHYFAHLIGVNGQRESIQSTFLPTTLISYYDELIIIISSCYSTKQEEQEDDSLISKARCE